jgi:hypothetical protein
MSLAVINSVPTTDAEFNTWAFAHMANHRDINRLIFTTKNTRINEFHLAPFAPDDMETWLLQHQTMHQQMNAALGVASYDLSTVNWSNQSQLFDWIHLNANEHFIVNRLLNLG